jgi:hypothetical protein
MIETHGSSTADQRKWSSSSWNERRVAGALLVLGFGLLMVRAALFALDDASLLGWSSDALGGGLITTILGLTTLELALHKAGQQVLARLGATAYLVGALPWLVAETTGTFVFEIERNYVVLTCVSLAAYTWAMLRVRLLPVAVGWASIAFVLAWGMLYLGRVSFFIAPLGPSLAILVIGLFLLLRPGQSREQAH